MTTRTEQGYAERLAAGLKAVGGLDGLTAGDIVEVVLGVRDEKLDQAQAEVERFRVAAEAATAERDLLRGDRRFRDLTPEEKYAWATEDPDRYYAAADRDALRIVDEEAARMTRRRGRPQPTPEAVVAAVVHESAADTVEVAGRNLRRARRRRFWARVLRPFRRG